MIIRQPPGDAGNKEGRSMAKKKKAAKKKAARKTTPKRKPARKTAKKKAAPKRKPARKTAKKKAAPKRKPARKTAKKKAAPKRKPARETAKKKAAPKRRSPAVAKSFEPPPALAPREERVWSAEESETDTIRSWGAGHDANRPAGAESGLPSDFDEVEDDETPGAESRGLEGIEDSEDEW
jgi:hypothetical protein